MSKCSKPKITTVKKTDDYTKITFKPDLAKFGMVKLDDDILGVLQRRVYDLAGTVQDLKVTLNGTRLKIRNFKGYVDMFVKALQKANAASEMGDDLAVDSSVTKPTIVHEKINDRWEVAFAVTDGNSFNQVSFVNSIATSTGGTHITYVADQLVTKVMDHVKKKNKNAPLRPIQIRNSMFLFVNCLIENPAFTSQTKEQLTTKVSAFGSKCVLPDDFIKKVLRTSIVEKVMNIATRNADKELKKTDGGKKKRLTGFVKLEDANKAGTRESHLCTLILTEGDSAMALAVAGLAVVGRDYYGVFPLRGKMLNVRDASYDQVTKNAEINAIKQIMGLQHKKHYNDVNGLRYGHIMIMTDQDHDGSHIKGLIINFLESSFPGLLQVPGFLVEFITPIVKVSIMRGKKVDRVIPFYTMPQYETWRDSEGQHCIWKQKYYKGLGTSEPNREGREYFSQLEKHRKTFLQLQEDDKPLIELAFGKKKADARKDWLRAFRPGTHLDPDLEEIPISEFINKELILFSMADNIRSIPSVMDGFKPGQRKIIYGCFKRNLVSEIKVAQLGGYVSENTGYHHGEQSLYQTITGLAQDFVGSNNLYFLMPNGSFGSRATGGKDASAPRYIFTELNKLTRKIFNQNDDPLYKYMDDDDSTVEPEWYAPVIPTLLVNGAEGIGTGWSTNIPCYNPEDIVDNIRRMLDGGELVHMAPWYRGWTGTIEQVSSDKFKVSGIINQIDDNTVEITELPVKMWTQTMKEFLLDSIIKNPRERGPKEFIEDMTEEHGVGIRFVVTLSNTAMRQALEEGLENKFKLSSTLSLGNMVAFDPQGRLKKYESVEQILTDFFYVRLDLYQKRKDYMSNQLKNQLEKISNQARFVNMIIEKKLNINNRKKIDLIADLESLHFPKFGKDGVPVYAQEQEDEAELSIVLEEFEEAVGENATVNPTDINAPSLATYEYLLGMPIWSLTRERYEKLLQQRGNKEIELNSLLKLSAKDLWNKDLDEFVIGWREFLADDTEKRESMVPLGKSKGKKKVIRKRKSNDDDDVFRPPGVGSKKSKAKNTIRPESKSVSQSTLQFVKSESTKQSPEKKSSIFGSGGLFQSFIDKKSPVSKKTNKDKFQLDPEDLESDLSGIFNSTSETNDKEPNKISVSESNVELDTPSEVSSSSSSLQSKSKVSARSKTAISSSKLPKKATSNRRTTTTKKRTDSIVLQSDDDESTPSPTIKKVTRPSRATAKAYKIPSSDIEDDDDSFNAEQFSSNDDESFEDF